MSITVSPPDLEPGAIPRETCDGCGAGVRADLCVIVTYYCGMQVALNARSQRWESGGCPRPSTPAVVAAMLARGDKPSDIIDAVLAGLTPEQRALWMYPTEGSSLEGSGEAIIDALKKAGA